ncbi:MAG: nucleotidyltransferase domain-containing protein [Desulfobacterales bacterium]|nr:nucleotidyltransferase domain-containing protein [Desulfobacterales bacterium]
MITRRMFKEEVRSVVKQLIKSYHPEKVILFGSLSDKKKFPRDIDLFIIKKNPPHLGVERVRELDRTIKYKIATDFIVYTPEEVKKREKLGDPFVKTILEKGNILYEKE